jgi:FAD binding domain
MPLAPSITATNQKAWTNRHDTVHLAIDNLFDIANGETDDIVADYNATTVAIQGLIRRGIQQNKRLRALGGGWSFNEVAATDGWLLNTKLLNMLIEIRNAASVSDQYQGQRKNLLFAQCGNSMQELNNHLQHTGRSLKTSGASNGQTIAGAFSTGTHGSAIDFGSTPDFIVGMHIIISPDEHIWLEKESYPVVSDLFTQRLQTKLIRNDDMFNAALVSFGSFGFIHGVMLETEDIYLLECYRQRYPLDASLKHVMETLDFSQANFLPHGIERPFHFQVVVNQYDLNDGVYVTIMYKRAYRDDYQPPVVDHNKAGPGDDVPAFLGRLTQFLPVVTPLIVNNLIKTSFVTFSDVWGTSGEIFTNMETRGKLLSTAIGIPISFVNQVNEMLIELNDTHGPFSGIFSYRYVKGSKALLAFTKFDQTCIVELDGAESVITRNFYHVVWNELTARNIPHTFHWGKISNLDSVKLEGMYQQNFSRWIKARNTLMPVPALQIFNNQTLVKWGLDKILLRPF